jgi:tetratricopeptide (TPR) repeat protein
MQHLIKGSDYGAQGRFEEAKKEFEKVSRDAPLYQSAENCLKVLEDVSEKKIKNKTAIHLFKGADYWRKGQYDQAIASHTKAIELDPRYVEAYYNRGIAYRSKGQYDQAIADYTKIIELNPRIAEAYYNRGVAYADGKGQFDQAIADCTKAIELNPRYTDAYRKRGLIYVVKLGNKKKGCSDLKQACELGDCMMYTMFSKITGSCD